MVEPWNGAGKGALRTRIAPTPSGFLHVGNALNFLLAWKIARAAGGTIMLRIDDLDAERTRPEYLEGIFRSLEWLGIGWDEGPRDPDDHLTNWSQHLRMEGYRKLLDTLRAKGVLFACDCTRSRSQTCECAGKENAFDKPNLSWRLKTSDTQPVTFHDPDDRPITMDLHAVMPAPVLRQRDGSPAYQIASVADDDQPDRPGKRSIAFHRMPVPYR